MKSCATNSSQYSWPDMADIAGKW